MTFAQGKVDRDGRTAIPVRGSGTEAPVFFVPTLLGDHSYVVELARDIGDELPVYALPWPPFNEQSPRTLEAFAELMIPLIRTVQPRGPYRLAGYSSGGLVIYAVAQHLLGQDEGVSFLGLIDVGFPAKSGAGDRFRDSTSPLALGEVLLEARRQAVISPQVKSDPQFWQQVESFARACDSYLPIRLPIQTDTFYAAGSISSDDPTHTPGLLALVNGGRSSDAPMSGPKDPTCGWRHLLPTSQISTHPIPGDHLSLIADPVHRAELGAAITSAIAARTAAPTKAMDEHDPLLPLTGASSRDIPIFFLPGAGDSVTAFSECVMEIGTRAAMYGLQPRGILPEEYPHTTVEAAATHYLRSVDGIADTGPVHLVGHSFGGVVAFEMALRRRQRGALVASLTILDSEPPLKTATQVGGMLDSEIRREFIHAMELHYEVSLGLGGQALLGTVESFVGRLHAAMVVRRLIPERSSPAVLVGPLQTFSAANRASYCPGGTYEGNARLLLVADPSLAAEQDADRRHRTFLSWKEHVPHVEVSHGPGNHFTLLSRKHAAWLASWLAVSWGTGR